MPLSRFQLRNEYGLGARELYNDASKREDPKAVLDGVAVAGLVGLLRQLGDLAEFAAEVFHGLQEDITTTASRSRKLMTRVKNIETALPPLEKAMLSQTSHIHFAYTPGTEWHPRIKIEQNHFIYTDLPRCIVDSYEECREPPRLPLLDRFDTGGPGSCLKRYSDPTFFRRASGNSSMLNDEKSNKDKKARKAKKRRSWKRSSQISFDTLNFSTSGRVQFSSTPRQRQPSPNQTVSAFDMTFKSDLVDRSGSLGSGDGMGYIECVFHPSGSVQTTESKTKHSISGAGEKLMSNLESKYPGKQTLSMTDDTPRSSVVDKNGYSSSTDTWDEKASTVEPISQHTGMQEVQSLHKPYSEFGTVGMSGDGEVRELQEPTFQFDEPDVEPMGLNMRSYEVPELPETNFEAHDPESVSQISEINEMPEVHETKFETDGLEMEPLDENCGGNEELEVHETNLQPDEQEIERQIDECFTVIHTSFEAVDSPSLIPDKNQCDEIESETDNFEDALNTIESESEADLDCQTKGQLRSCSRLKDDFQDDVDNERVAEREPPSLSFNDMDLCDSTSSPLPDCPESLQHTPASHDTLGGEPCEVPENFVSSVNSDVGPPLQSIQLSPVRDVSSEISPTKGDGNADGLQKDSVGDECLSSEIEETGMMARMSEQPSVASSNVAPVALWTNGGLFGLQPSKPPDFSTSGSANSNNGISSGHFNQNLGPKDVANLQEEVASSANDPRCDNGNKNLRESTLVSDNHEMDSSKKVPIPCLNSGVDKKLNSSIDSGLSNISAHSQSQLLPTMMHPEAKAPQCADVGNTSNKAIHVNEAKPSFLTGLGHGLLSNGFRRTRSMEYYEKPKEVSLEKKPDLDNSPSVTLRRSSSGTKLREEVPSVISGPPSPALEHMKISFQPINSFGTSKLKLKYPEGINHYDEDSDALFPSFQLVPEPALQHGIDSDSDNDTFCRSNPYISDDDLSHLSDSNSELWGSDYSSEIRDHTAHNSLCRISSGDSLSSLAEHEEMKNKVGVAIQASSSPVPDIPILQAMNPFDLQELNPEAPPLPPLQWRVLKPQSDLLEGKEKIPDFTSLFSDLKAPGSSFPHPAKPASVDLVHTVSEHVNVTAKNKESGVQKLKVNARREDEREDFLEQIRTRSFNLRKTGLLKPAPPSIAPAPSVKVTAILQKANAIRQAVASDDGEEDDPWSDT